MADTETETDGLLDVGDLVRMFEESEDATLTARELSERDRDYVDNIQLTETELAALEKRGQPPVIDNRIKTKIDFLVGLEKQQRISPKALPRTPAHEQDADGASQALRYVADTELYDAKRSGVWRNMLVEGAGGIRVYVEPSRKYGGQMEIKIDRVAWDRMFWDPHSSEADFSDAGYLGVVLWMDYNDALAKYPDGKEALDTTLAQASPLSQTFDDKPSHRTWADKKRKRIRICQIWIKRDEQWHFAEYTKGGILKAGPSPHLTDTGESDCELFFQSAFVNRENERYGYVREMISPQDEVNKRRSKSLHLLNSAQVVYEEGAVEDIEEFRKQAVRPDGTMKVAPGALAEERIQFNTRTDLAEGHFKLLQEAQNSIDLKGPNATMLGDKAQGSASASGKAIIASQQGGMISLGDLTDNLRHLDLRVFRAIWNRIRQHWNAEKWIRTTDDQRNIKWVGMNVNPMQIQMAMQQNPEIAEKIAGSVRSVAELDCDIIIDEAPDNLTPQLEQFQALVELKKMDAENKIPFRAIVEAIPNLKNRDKFLEHMDEQAKQPPPPPPEIMKAQIDGQVKMQTAQLDAKLQAQKSQMDAAAQQQKAQTDALVTQQKAASEIQLKREMAEAELALEQWKAQQQAALEQWKAEQANELAEKTAAQQAKIAVQKAKQQPQHAA